MMPTNTSTPFRDVIGRHVVQRDVELQRQRANLGREARQALRAVGTALPPLLPEYAKMLGGSILGFWIIAWCASLVHIPAVWTYLAFGMLYAGQATWYGHKLAIDPAFRIPRCGCTGATEDNAESVLRSESGRLLGVPNAVWALLLYVLMIALVLIDQRLGLRVAAITMVSASATLGFVMIVRIRALCTTCINMAAINVLLLWRVLA